VKFAKVHRTGSTAEIRDVLISECADFEAATVGEVRGKEPLLRPEFEGTADGSAKVIEVTAPGKVLGVTAEEERETLLPEFISKREAATFRILPQG